MPSHVVARRDPQRVAGAVIRYQVGQPRFLSTMFVVLVGVALLGSTQGAGAAVLAVLVFVVLVVLVVGFKRGQLVKALAARGYRPGSTVEASADELELTVTAATGSGRHPWSEIQHVRVVNGIVLFRMRAARFVVAVPMAAMPEGWAERVSR